MSLKSSLAKQKKKAPPPKYLCLPNSLQPFKKCIYVNFSDEICCKLAKLMNSRGNLTNLLLPKDHLTTLLSDGNKTVNFSKACRILRKQLKTNWLNDPKNKIFWSHILFGVNHIMRHLEQSTSSSYKSDKLFHLSCLMLDSGWINSPVGHHLAQLCGNLDIPLVVVKPPGKLRDLVSTKFRPLQKLIAFGLCSSVDTPSDLQNFLKTFANNLHTTDSLHNAATDIFNHNRTVKNRKRAFESICLDELSFGEQKTKRLDQTDGEPWESFDFDLKEFYGSLVANLQCVQPISLYTFWSLMSTGIFSETSKLCTTPNLPSMELHHTTYGQPQVPLYDSTMLYSVKPQSTDERLIRKAQLKKTRKSLKKNKKGTRTC